MSSFRLIRMTLSILVFNAYKRKFYILPFLFPITLFLPQKLFDYRLLPFLFCPFRCWVSYLLDPSRQKQVKSAPHDSDEKSVCEITVMSSPAARFIGAASDRGKKVIQALLKEGIDVNIWDWDELNVFASAASSGFLEIVKVLQK